MSYCTAQDFIPRPFTQVPKQRSSCKPVSPQPFDFSCHGTPSEKTPDAYRHQATRDLGMARSHPLSTGRGWGEGRQEYGRFVQCCGRKKAHNASNGVVGNFPPETKCGQLSSHSRQPSVSVWHTYAMIARRVESLCCLSIRLGKTARKLHLYHIIRAKWPVKQWVDRLRIY